MDEAAAITQGLAFQNAGDLVEAEKKYQSILAENPKHPEALQLLGQLEQRLGNWDAAEKLYLTSLEADPDQFEVWANYGALLSDLRRPNAAEKALANSLLLKPDYAPALKWQAAMAMIRGEKDASLALFEKAQQLNPKLVSVYAPITKNKNILPGDALVSVMQELLEDPVMEAEDKADLHYALAYVFERAGDSKTFFRHLHEANSLQDSLTGDWEEDLKASIHFTKELMTVDFLSQKVPENKKKFTPVFIVGMPRSGSTLIEQMLASHTGVFGGDELPYFLKFLARVTGEKTGQIIPFGFGSLEQEDLARIATMYQHRVGKLAPDAPFITDKMPWNFHFIGMISKIFPWAKVIHIHRDPMDCGFSIYRNSFAKNLAHCCSFEAYARYRKIYRDIMAFWNDVLPAFTLDVKYENLVTDPKGQIRRICEFCGLDFQDGMLEFYKTRREIRTLSLNQVLKPINRDSIGIAQKYKTGLQPLEAALKSHGLIK